MLWTVLNYLRTESIVGSCEHGNEPSCPINGGEYLDHLSNCEVLEKDSVPWN
jgi:hypothetical protein